MAVGGGWRLVDGGWWMVDGDWSRSGDSSPLTAIVDDSDGRGETTLAPDYMPPLSVHFSASQSRLDNPNSPIAHRIRFIRGIRGCSACLYIYLSIYLFITPL